MIARGSNQFSRQGGDLELELLTLRESTRKALQESWSEVEQLEQENAKQKQRTRVLEDTLNAANEKKLGCEKQLEQLKNLLAGGGALPSEREDVYSRSEEIPQQKDKTNASVGKKGLRKKIEMIGSILSLGGGSSTGNCADNDDDTEASEPGELSFCRNNKTDDESDASLDWEDAEPPAHMSTKSNGFQPSSKHDRETLEGDSKNENDELSRAKTSIGEVLNSTSLSSRNASQFFGANIKKDFDRLNVENNILKQMGEERKEEIAELRVKVECRDLAIEDLNSITDVLNHTIAILRTQLDETKLKVQKIITLEIDNDFLKQKLFVKKKKIVNQAKTLSEYQQYIQELTNELERRTLN